MQVGVAPLLIPVRVGFKRGSGQAFGIGFPWHPGQVGGGLRNSLRRFMPTLAKFLDLDPQQARAVGTNRTCQLGWVRGCRQVSAADSQARFILSKRYSRQASGLRPSATGHFGHLLRHGLPLHRWCSSALTWADLERERVTV